MKTIDKKAFFFDFDGTIWFGSYGDRTLKALNVLHNKGHLLFYNSGRSRGNTRIERVSQIPFDGFLYGGSQFRYGNEDVFRKDISKEVMQKVITTEKKHDLLIIYEGVEGVYKRRGILPQYNGDEQDDISVLLDVKQYPITKFSIIKKEDGKGGFLPLPKEAVEKLSEDFIIIDLEHYVECLLHGMGKDVVTKKAIEYLGVDIDNVYAFGDSFNDLTMFKVCKHNVAIGHSPKEIKDLAEYVTKEELNGVAEALLHLGFITEEELS